MSVNLIDALVPYVRGLFDKRECAEVREYAGEFSAAEVPRAGFKAPAVLVTVLGWREPRTGETLRMAGRDTRLCSVAAFVVVKGDDRNKRMRAAMAISDRLTMQLPRWAPAVELQGAAAVAGVEPGMRAENLYSAKLDSMGMALWLVTWQQCAKGAALPQGALYDMVQVDIESDAITAGVPADVGGSVDELVVTHDIDFTGPQA